MLQALLKVQAGVAVAPRAVSSSASRSHGPPRSWLLPAALQLLPEPPALSPVSTSSQGKRLLTTMCKKTLSHLYEGFISFLPKEILNPSQSLEVLLWPVCCESIGFPSDRKVSFPKQTLLNAPCAGSHPAHSPLCGKCLAPAWHIVGPQKLKK